MTLMCHPKAKSKDLADKREILLFAQNVGAYITV
jgi:hypothetical protein